MMEGDALTLGFVGLVAGLGWLVQRQQWQAPAEVAITFGPLEKDRLCHVFRAQDQLHKAGIRFDTSMDVGLGQRDWELDWSLHGPAEVRFRRFKG
jgi:hypothetical protein